MQIFSKPIHIDANQPLGGYLGRRLSDEASDELELNGLGFRDKESGLAIEICSIDSLYAGELACEKELYNNATVFSASHTHYAPMLDKAKPQLGQMSTQALEAWREAISTAERKEIVLTTCNIYTSEVHIPIYRRFDSPNTWLNRFLTVRAGMYPNENQKVDKNIYVFEFCNEKNVQFLIVLHCCHPVSRSNRCVVSSDYVGSIRTSLREKFGNVPCLFFLGCSGDIRPNFSRKRVGFLPKSRLNWRFERNIPVAAEKYMDDSYQEAIRASKLWKKFKISNDDFEFTMIKMPTSLDPELRVPQLLIAGKLKFVFVPFEVSHLFHLEAQSENPLHFIVSCAGNTFGYLAHPDQMDAGGYEVDGALSCMGLSERIVIKKGVL